MSALGKAFDPQTVLLAKHAQHVVLVHFPIALFITGIALAWTGRWTKRAALGDAGYYNFLIAAISTVPVMATGLLAWRFQLEGQKLKGLLLLHLMLAGTSSVLMLLVWWFHFRTRQQRVAAPGYWWAVESVAVAAIGLTGHLGGLLSGVNGH